MLYLVEPSKWLPETISFIIPFSDVMQEGDSIVGVPSIQIVVLCGEDANPSNLLYEGVSVLGGNSVEQRFRLGVAGVIYSITFSVSTNLGKAFEKSYTLAILPESGSAIPTWLPLWETTNLYPLQFHDNIQSGISWASGDVRIGKYNIPHENIQSSATWISGALIGASVTYNIPHEDIQSSISWLSGTLIETQVTYNIPHEDIDSRVAWLSGTLVGTSVTYNIPHEDIKSGISWTGGTLV